jgi:hypothetical protein
MHKHNKHVEAHTSREAAASHVRKVARAAAHERGESSMTYADVARHCPSTWPARFIAEQCELAGFPVWTTAPDEALKPR